MFYKVFPKLVLVMLFYYLLVDHFRNQILVEILICFDVDKNFTN